MCNACEIYRVYGSDGYDRFARGETVGAAVEREESEEHEVSPR